MLRKFGHGRFLRVWKIIACRHWSKKGDIPFGKRMSPFSWRFCAGRSLTFHLSGSLDRFVQHLRVELVEFRALVITIVRTMTVSGAGGI